MVKKAKRNKFRDRVAADSKKQRTSGYGYLRLPAGVQLFNEEPGERVLLDFVPYVVTDKNHPDFDEETQTAVKGDVWYKRPFRTHRNVGVNNETVVCPASTGKKCPLCEYRKERANKGADQDELRELSASRRNLYIVIPRDHKKYEEEPHLWDISAFCFQNMLDDEIRENEENGGFPDLAEGKTLKVRFSEESIGKNKFAKVSRIDFEDRDALDEDIVENVPNLDDLLTILPYEKIDAKFMQSENEDEEKDDDRKAKSKKKARARDEEDEEEEEEEDEDDSKGGKGVKARQKDEEDEDEEDEEEEEEEEEDEDEPRSKKKIAKRSSKEDEEEEEEEDEEEDEDGEDEEKEERSVRRKKRR